MADLNCFTCTLGQALRVDEKNTHPYKTINDFLDHQAFNEPYRHAVGFPDPSAQVSNGRWDYKTYLYSAQNLGMLLRATFEDVNEQQNSGTVALLCPSSLEFLFTWLGLMRLGYSVLLVAPQCQPPAIAHLCKTCNVKCLIYDDAYSNLAQKASELQNYIFGLLQIPKDFRIHVESQLSQELEISRSHHASNAEYEDAYFFHTSGTSSGLPKPIPQTHHAAIGVLPCLPDGYKGVTFTTTPLYHGGIADCFRTWTSSALIWLFPGKDVPITASNILKCLDCAKRAQISDNSAPVKYFSSVPYVLQMVSSEPEGMKMLQGMDMIGVGGAALPQDVGDELVYKGVNLVSRFGSAECGFLLSSHRNYEEDKEWQYLRSSGSNLLKFEPQNDGSGLSELVIQPDWPHMAKRNRDDGSFATADLFAPHPTIKDAWKYHSRADSQLTLITGNKFDPAPLEAVIASNGLLRDALIFGNGMQCPGALLFRSESAKEMDKARLLVEIWPVIEKLNKEGQAHTRLSKSMLVVMDPEAPGLEKSSKGTVMRAQAEKRYEKEIREAYGQQDEQVNGVQRGANEAVPDHEVPIIVLEIIKEVTGSTDRIPEDADLFSYGVDSVACMAIRAKLQSRILDQEAPTLPLNVVYDCGNIKRLSKYLVDLRKGRVTESEDEIQLMKDLVAQYSKFETQTVSRNTDRDDGEDCTNGLREEATDGEHV
ncbi:MAG: hypothetical protein Q9181_005172, partial [Wetmoreana brouardii]